MPHGENPREGEGSPEFIQGGAYRGGVGVGSPLSGSSRGGVFNSREEAQRVWRMAWPNLIAPPILPNSINTNDGATPTQMRNVIVNNYLLNSNAGFGPKEMEFVHIVDQLLPADLVPHYQHTMLALSPARRLQAIESQEIADHWADEAQRLVDERTSAALGTATGAVPLTKRQQEEQDNSEFFVKYASRAPSADQPDHASHLGAQQYLGLLMQDMEADPRWIDENFTKVRSAIESSAQRLYTQLGQNGRDRLFMGESRANQAVANARIGKIYHDMAISSARLIADMNLGRAKFDYAVIKGERSFEQQLAVDDYMNQIRQEALESRRDDQLLQQRRLLNQNNAYQVREAGQNYADLIRQNAQALAQHARGLDENLLKYGGKLTPGDQYVRNYEPGGAVEKLFGRAGIPFKPQHASDNMPFQQELPLMSLAQLLDRSEMEHPYNTGVPQSNVPGLPQTFQPRPPVPDFVSPYQGARAPDVSDAFLQELEALLAGADQGGGGSGGYDEDNDDEDE